MQVYDCRVNHLANPLGYQIKEPVFSWKVGGAAGKKQKAARILVSLKEDFSEAVLDTGWIWTLWEPGWEWTGRQALGLIPGIIGRCR